jgi:starch-binding outer membrane protein, SusD/RagB family
LIFHIFQYFFNMKKIKNFSLVALLFAFIASQTACIKEYTDPSSIVDTQVVTTVDGLIGLCNGMQARYSVGRQSPLYQGFSASGLSSLELRLLTVGNTDELNLQGGSANVVGGNNIVSQLWNQSYLTIKEANLVLNNLSIAANPTTNAVITSYASVFKAMSFGTLATYFEKMPVTIGKAQPFVTRDEALRQAVVLLENAEKAYTNLNAGDLAIINGKLSAGFDVKNTIVALQARYNLMLKDYGKAKAAADKVDLTKKSAFRYDAVNVNPIFFVSYSNTIVLAPQNKQMGLPNALAPDTLDKRLPFYLNPAGSATVNLGFGFARSNTTDIPVYLPGEMRLIKAECLAQTDAAAAIVELNGVIKKKAADDAWGIGADLAAGYTGLVNKDAVLTEIYRQRCIELFNSGLRLEDSRRLGRPGPKATGAERTRTFYPYPQTERDNNPTQIPPDPAE